MTRSPELVIGIATMIACATGCAASPQSSPAGVGLPVPVIDDVVFPDPVLPGSPVLVRGGKLGTEALDHVTLEIRANGRRVTLAIANDDALDSSPSARWFRVTASAHTTLGSEGSLGGTCTIHVERAGVRPKRVERACGLRLATSLVPALLEDVDAEVFRDDRIAVAAAELPLPGEGELHLEVDGTFTIDGVDPAHVSASLPVVADDLPHRDHAELIASSALGGIRPGTFEGTMWLASNVAGFEMRTPPRRLALRFRTPVLEAVAPTVVSLGQIITVSGGGFVATDDGSAGTQLELTGTFVDAEGNEQPCCVQALVPESSTGREARVEIAAAASEDGLSIVSEAFGARSGRFTGSMVAVTTNGSERVETSAIPVDFVLGTRQVVYVHFVPSFDASLERFGLGAANAAVREATIDRVRRIFDGFALDLRTDPPSDFTARGFATLEIGGPDPNGVGLFGYDNTPGKDVGNLRLFDRIGGLNALTQLEADGAPGFGGVFIDSFLYWSADPGLPDGRPLGAPEIEPAFDAIFGPVRARAATAAEVESASSDGDRVAIVAEAVRVLGAIIGETAAHELGHSLGLAEPYGSPTIFHSLVPDEGCLMDEGGQRPFDERAELPGAAPTRFCGDEPAYLAEILGGAG